MAMPPIITTQATTTGNDTSETIGLAQLAHTERRTDAAVAGPLAEAWVTAVMVPGNGPGWRRSVRGIPRSSSRAVCPAR